MGYRGKLTEQVRARELRAAGWTMPDIAAELGVSRGSVSAWTRDIEVVVRRRASPRPPNRLQRAKAAEIERGRIEGVARIGELSDRDLLVAGTALYAGEGAKTDGKLVFANSDPRMVELFLRWLRTCFEVDESKLRVRLYLHQGLDLEAARTFWSERTGIPLAQFGKPYRAVADPSIRRSKHPMGCVGITYYSASTHRAIMGLVAALLPSSGHNPG